jgi:ribosomal protein S18 acetylase RimI-like enzyme
VAEIIVPLTVRDLTADDLPVSAWAGSRLARALERAERGEIDYLAVCPPSGVPVAFGGINYTESPGAGAIFQLSVMEPLRCCGIGTLLLEAAEGRVRGHGLESAELAVDERNPRAQDLYRRLGYLAYDRQPAAWHQDGPDGTRVRYETMIILFRKNLI